MRILHFCETFSRLSETFIYDLITELERHGTDNHVVTLDRVNADTRPFPRVQLLPMQARLHPERLWRQAFVELGLGRTNELIWPAARRGLAKVVGQLKPDIIHAHFGPSGVLIAPVAHRLKVPLVVTFHGFDATRFAKSEYWRAEYQKLWPATAAVVGVSEHICSRLHELGAPASKLRRIGNGVDLSKFTYSDPSSRFDGKNVRCLFVGRLVEKKAPIVLAKAFQVACKRVPPALHLTLDIVGDGPLMSELRQFVIKEELSDVVRIHGSLTHADVMALFARAHLYVQHSVTASDGDQEGQPVSLIEAAAFGLPIVSTRHSGIPGIVEEGVTGFLVEECDFASMGKAIACLGAHPETWGSIAQRSRKKAELDMNLETQTESWVQLYRSSVKPS